MFNRILLAACVSVSGLVLTACTSDPPIIFDPRAMQHTEQSAAEGAKAPYLRPLPTTREDADVDNTQPVEPAMRPTTGPVDGNETVVAMSLHEIIHRAVTNNNDVKVAGYQPGIEGSRVIEARAQFDPNLFTNFQYQYRKDLTGGQIFNSFNGGLPFTSFLNETDTGTFQIGIQQNLQSGGQVTLQYQDTYNWSNPQVTNLNPFYESDLSLQINQPLLKNFGYNVNQAQITINRINQKVSLLEFRKAVEQNAADIEKAYWQLVQAHRDVKIQEDLVAQTEETYNVLYTRMKTGIDVSQLQVTQAQTELETRRGDLAQFRAQERDLSDQLKALMSDPEFPVMSSIVIDPADDPVDAPMEFDLQEQVDTALANRFELGEQQLKIDAAAVTVEVAKNNLLPELDFIASVGPQGAAGDLGTAIAKSSYFKYYDATAGFKFQMPIGNRGPRAILQRTRYQQLQAMAQYAALVQQVALDVKTNARAVDTAWNLIVQNRRARFAAEEAIKAIGDLERANEPLRPEFVELKLDRQQRLAQAAQAEAQAISNYNIAIALLERAKGTLLRYNNVLLEEEDAKLRDQGLLK